MPHHFDYLIIGSGIAGLSYATKLARYYDEQGRIINRQPISVLWDAL